MISGNTPQLVGVHYDLRAYVCGPACIKPPPSSEGWMTFQQIYNARPNHCRYAVARMVPVFEDNPRGPYVVWDLYADPPHGMSQLGAALSAPKPIRWGETEDGVVMQTMALYERDE